MNVDGTSEQEQVTSALTRRGLVFAVGGAGLAAALTACTGYSSGAATSAEPPGSVPADQAKPAWGDNPPPTGDAQSEAPPAGEPDEEPADPPAEEEPPAQAANAFAKTADIPEGGGKIFEAEKVVITQPTPGNFKCFTAVCTHAGCTVASISGGTINCPCHGSKFKISDGSVAGGPAPSPLEEKQITVSGDSIVLA
ncbi:Rieske 2Fe-2S domain-containing protein [Herbidospora sp. NEAU-GS84]|uniref:Cytochrome bc1 complex Rieske iron-sulfur subunit n=1 Tax=Herbidospora solisilvae TaxID=2696284 RepID=A0A7C9JFK3_9ACTN|nr:MULTISPECIES: Rieske (2Fe-2S) protein [Herbidospora]NAS26044.1 Rieske 2Fe-2S domain-containing protein [Herbidospora solisilvae]GLX96840.1 hypothetical protein Hesp01_47900 [Herbidospora sp. NBRC 101105]